MMWIPFFQGRSYAIFKDHTPTGDVRNTVCLSSTTEILALQYKGLFKKYLTYAPVSG